MDQFRLWSRCALMLLGMVCLGGDVLHGQTGETYKTLSISKKYDISSLLAAADATDPAALKRAHNQRREILALRRQTQRRTSAMLQGRTTAGNATEIEEWFADYVFPAMTQTDDQSLNELGESRQLFFRHYLNGTPPSSYRSSLIEATIKTMRSIVEGKFHPACRVNAMFILGRLNDREGDRSSGVLPTPHPAAGDYLFRSAMSDDLPVYLRVVALTGVRRHAELRRPGSSNPYTKSRRREMAAQLTNLLTLTPDDKYSPEVAYWTERRAISILGLLGDPGETGQYAKTIRDIIGDARRHPFIRVQAMRSYGMLEFSADESLAAVTQTAARIGQFVADSSDLEAEYVDDRVSEIRLIAKFLDDEDVANSAPASRDESSVDRGGPAEDNSQTTGALTGQQPVVEILPEYERDLVRRRIKSIAWVARVTLAGQKRRQYENGLIAYADKSQVDFVKKLAQQIDQLMASVNLNKSDQPANDNEETENNEQTLASKLSSALIQGAESIRQTIKGHDSAGSTKVDEAANTRWP